MAWWLLPHLLQRSPPGTLALARSLPLHSPVHYPERRRDGRSLRWPGHEPPHLDGRCCLQGRRDWRRVCRCLSRRGWWTSGLWTRPVLQSTWSVAYTQLLAARVLTRHPMPRRVVVKAVATTTTTRGARYPSLLVARQRQRHNGLLHLHHHVRKPEVRRQPVMLACLCVAVTTRMPAARSSWSMPHASTWMKHCCMGKWMWAVVIRSNHDRRIRRRRRLRSPPISHASCSLDPHDASLPTVASPNGNGHGRRPLNLPRVPSPPLPWRELEPTPTRVASRHAGQRQQHLLAAGINVQGATSLCSRVV